jgi:hypothetical protein
VSLSASGDWFADWLDQVTNPFVIGRILFGYVAY